MASEGDQGGGGDADDPRIDLLKQYCLKTMKQVSHSAPGPWSWKEREKDCFVCTVCI